MNNKRPGKVEQVRTLILHSKLLIFARVFFMFHINVRLGRWLLVSPLYVEQFWGCLKNCNYGG